MEKEQKTNGKTQTKRKQTIKQQQAKAREKLLKIK